MRLVIPNDTALHNLFVDGALVRYRPDGNKATRAGPVLIAPLPGPRPSPFRRAIQGQ